MPAPAEMLLGLRLPNGWQVVAAVNRTPAGSGGLFSKGYIVENATGQRAFLKALDFSRALGMPDLARALQDMTTAYNYERDLLASCRHLDRVATAIDEGDVNADPTSPIGRVPYLIFELAEADVRNHLASLATFDAAWALRCLHQIATGLFQLYGAGVAHQDLKPSNVLVYGADDSRVGDLGCASVRGGVAPRDRYRIAGDASYAPPELLYGHHVADWEARRFGCDLYLFGSMVVFLFAKVSMNGLLLSHLDPACHPGAWAGDFPSVLPFLHDAFAKALASFKATAPPEVNGELTAMVRELCSPDPAARGHPKNRAARFNRFSPERYVSHMDLLATRAERRIVGRRP